MKNKANVIFSIAIIAGLAAGLSYGPDDHDLMTREYCENVELWNSQQHLVEHDRNGHPDYAEKYKSECMQ